MTERLYRGNVFFFFRAIESCERDKMSFGEIFEPVVDYYRSPYNLGVGELFTGYEDPHGLNFLFLGVNTTPEIDLSNDSVFNAISSLT